MPEQNDGRRRPVRTATWARKPVARQSSSSTKPESKPQLRKPVDTNAVGPRVVALGGGHGLAVALAAIRSYASDITAVVSVADDGGSSGRLRRDFSVLPPGDLRKALVALAEDQSIWREAFELRFRNGELTDHALGNLILVGLTEILGDFTSALVTAQELLHTVGRVLPATSEQVVLKGDVGGEFIQGQVALKTMDGFIRHVELIPYDAPACPEAVDAILDADQIVIAPGSLYTSIIPVLCVQGIRDAVYRAPGKVVHIANLSEQLPETAGLSGTDHLRAVLEHGARVNTYLYDSRSPLDTDEPAVAQLGIRPIAAEVASLSGTTHDPSLLSKALRSLV